jgi:hypothetical protein
MKTIILMITLLASFSIFAEAKKKEEKTLEIKAHIEQMMLSSEKIYRLHLREFAAFYKADEAFVPCLQKAMQEKKQATLVISAYSLVVKKCSL